MERYKEIFLISIIAAFTSSGCTSAAFILGSATTAALLKHYG